MCCYLEDIAARGEKMDHIAVEEREDIVWPLPEVTAGYRKVH